MMKEQEGDEIRLPLSEYVRVIAREAGHAGGLAVGKELVAAHAASCAAARALPALSAGLAEMQSDVKTLEDDFGPIKRTHHYAHYIIGAVGAGLLWALGNWAWAMLLKVL
jgi:hypothetical protein